MKKFFKTVLSLTISALLICGAVIGASSATVYTLDGYSFTDIDNTYISVCGWDDSSEVFIVPDALAGKFVSEIADIALMNDTFITSINYSRAVFLEKIGVMAFKGCTGISGTLDVPARLNSVGLGAFQECSSIESVNYYHGADYVAEQCFYLCTSLKDAIIYDGIKEIRKLAFGKCSSLETVTIPDSVTFIDQYAFLNDDNLTIRCYYGSYAAQFAEDNGIEYEILDPWNIPTEPPTEPETYAPGTSYFLGDADHDDRITVMDATKIQKCLAMLISDEDGWIHMAGSVDGLTLNVTHATYIQKYLASIPVNYPIGEERLIPTE